MRDILITLVIFILSSSVIFIFYELHLSYHVGQQVTIALFLFLLFFINALQIPALKNLVVKQGKWYVLFLCSVIVQLFVVITGGIYSPFLILFHLFVIAASFLFRMYVPLLFLVFALGGLYFQLQVDQKLGTFFQEDPGTAILYVISFFAIFPLVQVLSQRYRIKSTISRMLANQLKVEETILAEVEEMVIVTDIYFRILSINDVVEHTLQKSDSEIVGKQLFSILLMKDTSGRLMTQDHFTDDFLNQKEPMVENLTLFTSLGVMKIHLSVKLINDLEGEVGQICFIINTMGKQKKVTSSKLLTIASAKHEALEVELTRRLASHGLLELERKMLMLTKGEQDIKRVQEILEGGVEEKKVRADIALLCRQIVTKDAAYASTFHVVIDFAFSDFTEQDIKPLIANNTSISHSQLTGPFFTAPCEIQNLSTILTKLIDVAVLIASKEQDRTVRVSIARSGDKTLVITISTPCTVIGSDQLSELFVPYYGSLSERTNLHLGSGLEGYLAKSIIDQAQIPLQVKLTADPTKLVISLTIDKGESQTLSSLSVQTNTEKQTKAEEHRHSEPNQFPTPPPTSKA